MRKFRSGATTAAVLGSDQNVSRASGKKVVLNDVQRRVAKAMGLTDAEYIEGMS